MTTRSKTWLALVTASAGWLLCAAPAAGQPAADTRVPVCISVETKDASGFALPNAKDIADIVKAMDKNIAKRAALVLVSDDSCVVKVRVLGHTYEDTGGTTVLHQNPFNRFAITGTRKDVQRFVSATVTVGSYETRVDAAVRTQLFGQAGVSAAELSKAIEKWVVENIEAVEQADGRPLARAEMLRRIQAARQLDK